VAAALALWVLSGFYILPPDETGVIERFGRKILPHREPGLHYKLPAPIERLTRIKAREPRALEIGFRTTPAPAYAEPPAYEWNVQHREGRFQPRPEEALMLSGDQNMVELTAVVHYDLDRPDDYLFQQADPAVTIRAAAESVLHGIVNSTPLDELLTTERQALEQRAATELEQRMERYRTGARILMVKFQDVHPSVEVVDAFREVAGALEEKNRLINEAEGYRNEQVALARGRAQARVLNADAYRIGRAARAQGDAARFIEIEAAWRRAPGPNASRLYLETMEEILPGRRKLILDSKSGGRRALYSIEDGVLVAPPGASMTQPPAPFQMPQEEQ
jgi:HflK protein